MSRPGYPPQPNHAEKLRVFDLLQVGGATGITFSASFAIDLAASLRGLYSAHNGAGYFPFCSIDKKQVNSYAARIEIKSRGDPALVVADSGIKSGTEV